MKALIVINDAPFGSERPYNALRVASTLSARTEVELRVFLMTASAVRLPASGSRMATTAWIA